jgi:hypothetical protein
MFGSTINSADVAKFYQQQSAGATGAPSFYIPSAPSIPTNTPSIKSKDEDRIVKRKHRHQRRSRSRSPSRSQSQLQQPAQSSTPSHMQPQSYPQMNFGDVFGGPGSSANASAGIGGHNGMNMNPSNGNTNGAGLILPDGQRIFPGSFPSQGQSFAVALDTTTMTRTPLMDTRSHHANGGSFYTPLSSGGSSSFPSGASFPSQFNSSSMNMSQMQQQLRFEIEQRLRAEFMMKKQKDEQQYMNRVQQSQTLGEKFRLLKAAAQFQQQQQSASGANKPTDSKVDSSTSPSIYDRYASKNQMDPNLSLRDVRDVRDLPYSKTSQTNNQANRGSEDYRRHDKDNHRHSSSSSSSSSDKHSYSTTKDKDGRNNDRSHSDRHPWLVENNRFAERGPRSLKYACYAWNCHRTCLFYVVLLYHSHSILL